MLFLKKDYKTNELTSACGTTFSKDNGIEVKKTPAIMKLLNKGIIYEHTIETIIAKVEEIKVEEIKVEKPKEIKVKKVKKAPKKEVKKEVKKKSSFSDKFKKAFKK